MNLLQEKVKWKKWLTQMTLWNLGMLKVRICTHPETMDITMITVIVEKSLGEGEQYDDQYVVIKQGEEITDNDKLLVEQIKNKYKSSDKLKNVQVKSKHKILVYKDNEKVKEEWFFKVAYAYNNDKFLSFISPKQEEEEKFNFFTKGYEQFLNF